MKIRLNRQYMTRSGLTARIICVDRDNTKYPVVALLGEGDNVDTYTSDGKYYINESDLDDLDLISNTKTYWYNVYTIDNLPFLFKNEEEAKLSALLDKKHFVETLSVELEV